MSTRSGRRQSAPDGGRRIGEAHKGSQEHKRVGGFGADSELARRAGKKGIEVARRRYGDRLFSERGRRGGQVTRDRYGSEHFSELGRRGAEARRRKAQRH